MNNYLDKFKALSDSLKGSNYLHRQFSFEHFHGITLFGRSATAGTLEHIKKLDNHETDLIIHLVLGDMGRLNWIKFYGLNYKETMDLEFSEYVMMVRHLEKYDEHLVRETAIASDKMLDAH